MSKDPNKGGGGWLETKIGKRKELPHLKGCPYCHADYADGDTAHWAECEEAPGFVRSQARAEVRAR